MALSAAGLAVATGIGPVGAADAPTTSGTNPAAVELSAVEFRADAAWAGWVGAPIDGTVAFRVDNGTGRPVRELVAEVHIGDEVVFAPPVDIAAGGAAVVSVDVRLEGLPGARHDIAVDAGGATAEMTHRSVPWALVVGGAAAVNVALLHGRDRLRWAVTRRTATATGVPITR